MNSQTPNQDCLSYSYAYETNQTQTQTLLNKRYEDLRTQILELGSLGSGSPSSPLSLSSEAQWWEIEREREKESGQIGEEFNLITQQGMVSWLEVWLELKPIIRARDTDTDANTGTGPTDSPCKMLLMQRKKTIQPGQGQETETRKKSNGEGWGTQERGDRDRDRDRDRDNGMILDYPGALVGVLSDMVLNAINVAHLNNKYT